MDHDEDEGVGVEGSHDQSQHQEDQVDTTALIPTAQVGSMEKEQDGADRHNVCGVSLVFMSGTCGLRKGLATCNGY